MLIDSHCNNPCYLMFIVYLILYKSCIHYMYMKDFDWLMKSPDIVVTK